MSDKEQNNISAVKMDFFETVTTPPSWLNQEFFEKVLKGTENDKSLKITDISIIPATKPGDNMVSVLFRASVKYSSRGREFNDQSYIIKVEPFLDGMKKEMLANMTFFRTETKMYIKTLAEMQRLLRLIDDAEIIGPKLIYHSSDPVVLIFEDISKEGFEMHQLPLDFDETKKIILKLAKFHALGYFMQEDKNEFVTEFKDGLFNGNFAKNAKFLQDNYNYFADEVNTWEGFQAAAVKLNKLRSNFLPKLAEIYNPNKPGKGYNVLNHGDCHLKNMLFTLNGTAIDQIAFLDFQLSVWATPAIDLYYIFYLCASCDTRETYREELTHIYHNEFVSVLSKLGCLRKPPSLLDLNIELLKNGFLETFLTISFLPMFYMDFTQLALENFAEMTEEKIEEIARSFYRTPAYTEVIKKILPTFLHRGFLD